MSPGYSSPPESAAGRFRRPPADNGRRGGTGPRNTPIAGRGREPRRSRSWTAWSSPGLSAQRRRFFSDLLSGAQDLDLQGLAAQRPLELADLSVGLAQLAGRYHVLTGLHCRRRACLGKPLPAADHARRDVQLATELRHRFLARHIPLDRRPLELRREHPSPVGFPSVLAHRSSRRILRPRSEQSKWGALQNTASTTATIRSAGVYLIFVGFSSDQLDRLVEVAAWLG